MILYPNPTEDIVNISLSNESEFAFKIFNSIGEVVYLESKEQAYWSIDVSNLQNGEYIIVAIQNHKRVSAQKIIKK